MRKIKYGDEALGDYVKSRRIEKNISQKKLAKRLKITAAHLCSFEGGYLMFSPKILLKIPAALGIKKEESEVYLFKIKELYVAHFTRKLERAFKSTVKKKLNDFISSTE